MDLFEREERHGAGSESGLEAATVFEDIFGSVPVSKAKIEDVLAVERTDAARPSTEAVNQPRKVDKGGHLQDSNALDIALDPAGGGAAAGTRFATDALYRSCFRGNHNSTSIIGVGCRAECGSTGGVLIIGMGVDIAEVDRIRGAIERHGEVFLKRIYTAKEREYCEQFKNKYERYAGRFAAKEAAMKALGTGWRRGVRWVDLEVVREASGRPTLALGGEAGKIAQELGVKHIALSITHTEIQALAQVIFES
jgi:holo-[acyl-carrier protein] synthase